MRRRGVKESLLPQRTSEEIPKVRRRHVVPVLLLVACYAWIMTAFLPVRQQGPLLVVIGSMGSGTVRLTAELRGLGLDVTHEATHGKDGVVSWLHRMLYENRTRDLCSEFLPHAWHPQLVMADVPCATPRCWRAECPRGLERWQKCAPNCPARVREPVVLARHPLRTIESLLDFDCPGPQLTAAQRVLGTTYEGSCARQWAQYWRDYYSAFDHVVQRESPTAACDVVRALKADTARLRRARRACDGNRITNFFLFSYKLRRFILDSNAEGRLSTSRNRRNSQGAFLTWDDFDDDVRRDLRDLATKFGFVT